MDQLKLIHVVQTLKKINSQEDVEKLSADELADVMEVAMQINPQMSYAALNKMIGEVGPQSAKQCEELIAKEKKKKVPDMDFIETYTKLRDMFRGK